MNRLRKKKASIADLDRIILSFCEGRWLKVARVAAKTEEVFEKLGSQLASSAIDARLSPLVKNGRLEARGNIRDWRFSEMRLPP
jgi:hypothetical protein